jgi:cytosine/adenosine deaminase-related metal-dependent hydrolase
MTTPATSTIIRGGRVLDIARRRADTADVLVENGTIREIGPPGLAAPTEARLFDARDHLLIPGLVNAHTHGHGGLSRGLIPDRAPLELLLTVSGAVNGNRSVEDKYLTAQLSAIELVRKGCTACYDLNVEYPLPTVDGIQAAARAYRDVGIRAVIAPMMADRTLWEALPGLVEALPETVRRQVEKIRTAPWPASVEACREILRTWPFDRASLLPALGPTIPLHCSDEFLVACRDLARDFDVGIQTHLAESKSQAVLGLRKYGTTLTAHLDALGLVGPRFSGAHGVWLNREDVRRLAGAGASVAHNPLSNLRLGSGVAPARMMLEGGLTVGIGTDSAASSDTQNMFEGIRLAAYLSRVRSLDHRRWLSAEDALTMATEGSARVLGMANHIGRLAPGFKADITFLDLTSTAFVPLNNALLQIVNSESAGAVDSVMIDGRLVLERRRLTTVDEGRVRAQAEAAAARLREANAEAIRAARALEEYVGAFCLSQVRESYDLMEERP